MDTQQKIVVAYRKDESFQEFALNTTLSHANPSNRSMLNHDPFINLENALLGKRGVRNKKSRSLKEIILKNKVQRLINNFGKKLRLNSTLRKPLEDLEDHKDNIVEKDNFMLNLKAQLKQYGNNQGLILNTYCLFLWTLLNILQTAAMVFIFSVMMTFQQTQSSPLFFYIQVASSVIYVLDIVLNFILQRYENGKKLQKLNQIYNHYAHNGFLIDFLSILMLPLSLWVANTAMNSLFSVVFLVKLVNCIRKLEKFQYLLLTTNEKEHYYGLIKVFLTNFAIGHFLSVFLNLMASIDAASNWQQKMGVMGSAWQIKYIWGYYWGTNIMLTVGFGDITATNQYQAIILVFIQTFSCITLAYNISYVGALIGSIRENEESKKRKLKTFHRMCKENEITNEIQSKISNFIQESYQIRENFEHDARDEVIEFLPKQMQSEYRKEANKVLFVGLGFLSNLSKKSLVTLAEQVNRKICHPQQIIVKKGNISDFCVLQKGFLAFTCKNRSALDGKVIQTLSAEGQEKPKILSLDFIKNKTSSYNIKSINYSVLYYLSRQNFMQSLRGSEMDYQLFCLLKDKDEYIVNENNLYPCPNCKGEFHNKLDCSRLHFTPLKQHVIFKYLTKSNKNVQEREKFFRNKCTMNNIFHKMKDIEEQQQRYIEDNYDSDHYREIQELLMFYKRIPKDSRSEEHVKEESIHKMPSSTNNRRSGFATQAGMKSLFDEKAINKLEEFLEAKKENGFWEFEIDIAYDFCFYFKEGNPDFLSKLKRMRKHKNYNMFDKSANFKSILQY